MTQATATGVIERELRIAARPETVFPFFTDPEKLVQWMARKATLDARPGGVFRVDYNGFDIMRGEYLEVSPPNRVVFTWGWESEGNSVPPGASRVEVTLTADGAGTLLRMVHSGLPEPTVSSHIEGWDHFLPRLAIRSAGGDPGKDEWAPREAELLAAALKDSLNELRSLVTGCSEAAWQGDSPAEQWPVRVTADHVVQHLGLVDVALVMAAGQPSPIAGMAASDVDAQNVAHLTSAAGVTRAEVLSAIAGRGKEAVAALRALSDEALDRSEAMKFANGAPLSVRQIVQGPLLSDVADHVASIRAAIHPV